MSRYTLSDSARRDIDEVWEYIAQDNVDAANRVIEKVYERLLLLANAPHLGAIFPAISETIRHTTVGKYVIFYEPREAEVSVLRVLHGARDFTTLFQDKPPEDS
jgi:toxin ParE1/3/4